jgi:integrase
VHSQEEQVALRRQQSLIAERRLRDGGRWEEDDLVFPGQFGRPMWISSIAPVLTRLCSAHGLPRLPPHKLRHCHASLLLNEQVPLPLVSRRLGHANTHVTAAIYSHAVQSDEIAARAIDAALRR